jgi:hypothetical protein
MTLRGWVYRLVHHIRALEEAGLVIEAMREPPLPSEAVSADPLKARWARLPLFLMFRARRRGG